MIKNEQVLAQAIIEQASEDYRTALKKLSKHPDNALAIHTVNECEIFFRGEWFQMLTTLDGETLIRMLKDSTLKKIKHNQICKDKKGVKK